MLPCLSRSRGSLESEPKIPEVRIEPIGERIQRRPPLLDPFPCLVLRSSISQTCHHVALAASTIRLTNR